jgi:hypothetical protein
MLPNEAFRLGFMARCVEEGMSADETYALSKTAAVSMEKLGFTKWLAEQALGPVNEAAKTTKSLTDAVSGSMPLVGMGLMVPPLLGGTAAWLVNHATDTDGSDVEEAKQHELIDTYNRMSGQLQRQKQLQSYKANRKRTGQVFL